jgi:hypothetical protein
MTFAPSWPGGGTPSWPGGGTSSWPRSGTPSWPGLTRPSVAARASIDGRVKPGHDGGVMDGQKVPATTTIPKELIP